MTIQFGQYSGARKAQTIFPRLTAATQGNEIAEMVQKRASEFGAGLPLLPYDSAPCPCSGGCPMPQHHAEKDRCWHPTVGFSTTTIPEYAVCGTCGRQWASREEYARDTQEGLSELAEEMQKKEVDGVEAASIDPGYDESSHSLEDLKQLQNPPGSQPTDQLKDGKPLKRLRLQGPTTLLTENMAEQDFYNKPGSLSLPVTIWLLWH